MRGTANIKLNFCRGLLMQKALLEREKDVCLLFSVKHSYQVLLRTLKKVAVRMNIKNFEGVIP